jgi:hypothetical protein
METLSVSIEKNPDGEFVAQCVSVIEWAGNWDVALETYSGWAVKPGIGDTAMNALVAVLVNHAYNKGWPEEPINYVDGWGSPNGSFCRQYSSGADRGVFAAMEPLSGRQYSESGNSWHKPIYDEDGNYCGAIGSASFGV